MSTIDFLHLTDQVIIETINKTEGVGIGRDTRNKQKNKYNVGFLQLNDKKNRNTNKM